MTDSNTEAGTETLVAPARILERERRVAWWSPVLAPLQTLLALAPSHKSTKKGREKATQIRIGLIAVGILGLAFGGETLFIIIGGLIMALGLVIPMSEVRKRTLTGKLKRLRGEAPRDVRVSGEVEYDGRRLILRAEGEKLRRILCNRGEHSVRDVRFDDRDCIEVRPKSGGKSERIWICSRRKGADSSRARLERGDIDAPAFVKDADFQRLRDAIEAA